MKYNIGDFIGYQGHEYKITDIWVNKKGQLRYKALNMFNNRLSNHKIAYLDTYAALRKKH